MNITFILSLYIRYFFISFYFIKEKNKSDRDRKRKMCVQRRRSVRHDKSFYELKSCLALANEWQ